MSVSLSATVAIPGIPRFYKSNVQGSNKSISIIPNFLNGLILDESKRSNLSEVEVTLLGGKREESKSILLENTFIYGVDLNLWTAAATFAPSYTTTSYGYCSILNPDRYLNPPLPNPPVQDLYAFANPYGYLLKNLRITGNQLLGGTQDITYNPAQVVPGPTGFTPISSITQLSEKYVYPVIYHDAKSSCVTFEGWLEPFVTPLWGTFPFDACGSSVRQRPFDATLSLETNKTYRYEPGKCMTFTMGVKADLTGGVGNLNGTTVFSRASWGARNDTDIYRFALEGNGDFFVERITPYAETCLRVYRKDFIDPLDGGGPSELNIDFKKITMYSIEFSWYGAVGANFYAYVPYRKGEAKWIKIASLQGSNKYTRPVLTSPHMRLFTELYIPMGCTKIQSMGLYGSSVYMDGNFRDTLKYYTASTTRKPIEKIPKTFITLESPNFLDGDVSLPKNNANDYPRVLNGLVTVDSQIDIYEALAGGSTDINTAYYTKIQEPDVNYALAGNIINDGTTNIIYLSGGRNGARGSGLGPLTEAQKIDLMRRLVGTYFTFENPTTKYESPPLCPGAILPPGYPRGYRGIYSYGESAGNLCPGARPTGALPRQPGTQDPGWYGFGLNGKAIGHANVESPGAYWQTSSKITRVSSFANSDSIALILDTPIKPLFYAYTSNNATNIALRNSVAQTYNSGFNPITSYPSIPRGTPIFTPSDGRITINTSNNNNRSFIVTQKPIQKGSISFDTDLMANLNLNINGAWGLISESDYKTIQNNNYYLSESVSSTGLQSTTLSPHRQFTSLSQLYWATELVLSQGLIWSPNWYGFPRQAPFFSNGTWNYSEIPIIIDTAPAWNFWASPPSSYQLGVPKQKVATLFDTSTFTKNIDIRDHEFYFYGSEPTAVAGTDNINFNYIRVRLRPQDLLSSEDGVLTNNFYNFKLLAYGHNGQMYRAMAKRRISSIKGNWSEPNASLESMQFGPDTVHAMSDSSLESSGSFYYTVAFPKASLNAMNAFRSSPNIKFKFKSVFLRNIQYRSPLASSHLDRNAGLWYGTFFIPTLEPVHLFVFLQSASTASDGSSPNPALNYASTIYNAYRDETGTNLPRPLVTNIQLANARDKNNIILSEQPLIASFNTSLETFIYSFTSGLLGPLPTVNFNFEKIQGINTRVDSSTCQALNLINKQKKLTFLANKNIPFNYDLTSIYSPSINVFTPLQTSLLNKDFKRLYITAKKTQNESFGGAWYFSQNFATTYPDGSLPLQPFALLNPLLSDVDAARFYIDTVYSREYSVYLRDVLKVPALSDKYYIWSIYARSLSASSDPDFTSPVQRASQYVIFEHKAANANSFNPALGSETIYVIFDIINDRIAFSNSGTAGSTGWRNAYNGNTRNTFFFSNPVDDNLNTNTSAFSAAKSTSPNSRIIGYANLANKNNNKYVVAAHIEYVQGDPLAGVPGVWKRLSSCAYYKNNHTDNVIWLGTTVRTRENRGKISLWGFQEEIVPSDSTIDNLSAWYPGPYITQPKTGNATFNLMVGEQL